MLCQPRHLFVVGFGGHAGFMRMQAGAREDPVMLFSDLERTVIRARAGSAADRQNALQSCFARACEHLGAVGIEFVALNVGVGIDVHVPPSSGGRSLMMPQRSCTGLREGWQISDGRYR